LGWRTEEVEIPELGDGAVVLVRELSAAEKDDISFGMVQTDGSVDARLAKGLEIRAVVFGAIDEGGHRLFSNKDGRNAVGKLPSQIIKRLAGVILRLSKVDEEDTTTDIACPHCQATFPVNLTELLAKTQEAEAAKNE
jgi:hypothetical protein